MRVKCPKRRCQGSFTLGEGVCPECGFSLGLRNLFSFYGGKFKRWFKRQASIRCPQCGRANRLQTKQCACGFAFTFSAAVDVTVGPPTRKVEEFLRGLTTGTRRVIQLLYAAVSAALLWWTVAYVADTYGVEWFKHAALSIVFLTFFSLFAFWLVPKKTMLAVARGASAMTKIGLLSNFFTALLLIQIGIAEWPMRALVMAGVFGVCWIALFVLRRLILPEWQAFAGLFQPPRAKPLDYTTEQGRTAWFDRG